jgi:hypothetical protein
MQDLCWARLLEVGGVLCLHDYAEKTPGVVAAVDRFLARYRNYEVADRERSLLIIRKRAQSARPEVGVADRLWAALINLRQQAAASLGKRRDSS